MHQKPIPEVERHRIVTGPLASDESYGNNGAFYITIGGIAMQVIVSDSKEYKPVVGYEDLYEVSTYGEVYALAKDVSMPHGAVRSQDRKLLLPELTDKGYLRVSLSSNGHTEKFLVHVLVAKALVGNPYNYPEVNHIDGNKSNNVATNLEWCSTEYNQHHAIENGLRIGLTADEISHIKVLLDSGKTPLELSFALNKSRQTISDIKFGRHRNLKPDPPSGYMGLPIWEHVSVCPVSLARTPTWEEMCAVKDLFWKPDECVIQFHPPRSVYVNNHPYVLHLWRPIGHYLPLPPSILVGVSNYGPEQIVQKFKDFQILKRRRRRR